MEKAVLSLVPRQRQKSLAANVIAFKLMTTWLQIAGWIVVAGIRCNKARLTLDEPFDNSNPSLKTRGMADRLGTNMKTIHLVTVLGVLAAISSTPVPAWAAEGDGVAVAVVYDTSGSMKEQVRDGAGNLTPKYVIANRALENIANRIQAFATNTTTGTPRNIQAGLFVFDGANTRQAVKFGPFDAAAFKDWARKFSSPDGGTPLGNALAEAGKTVLNSGLTRKHVLIITDGENTLGPTPAKIMPQVRQQAEAQQTAVSVHFVAFDVEASVFSGVKKLGATVVGAADEIQLNKQLEFILEKKILLEDEEPPKKQ